MDSKSLKIQHGNVLYAQVIKRGLPRRYDRLHDNIYTIDQARSSNEMGDILSKSILTGSF